MIDEVRDVLSRSSVIARSPSITPERLRSILAAVLELAEWFSPVPPVFTWPSHPDDDHILNLAIAAKADYLVTWENRLLKLAGNATDDAKSFRVLAPQLEIITPRQFAEKRKNEKR